MNLGMVFDLRPYNLLFKYRMIVSHAVDDRVEAGGFKIMRILLVALWTRLTGDAVARHECRQGYKNVWVRN